LGSPVAPTLCGPGFDARAERRTLKTLKTQKTQKGQRQLH